MKDYWKARLYAALMTLGPMLVGAAIMAVVLPAPWYVAADCMALGFLCAGAARAIWIRFDP